MTSPISLGDRKRRVIHAFDLANQDAGVAEIEEEFSGLPDEVIEPWTDAPTR